MCHFGRFIVPDKKTMKMKIEEEGEGEKGKKKDTYSGKATTNKLMLIDTPFTSPPNIAHFKGPNMDFLGYLYILYDQ